MMSDWLCFVLLVMNMLGIVDLYDVLCWNELCLVICGCVFLVYLFCFGLVKFIVIRMRFVGILCLVLFFGI